MIGVIVPEGQIEVVREFFELFKTPWEFYEPGRSYEVVLAPANIAPSDQVPIKILFGSALSPASGNDPTFQRGMGIWLDSDFGQLPLYGECLVFQSEPWELPVAEGSGGAAVRTNSEGGTTIRLGYDLFEEVRILLSEGQPECNAHIPSLDIHIALLRDMILNVGVDIVEIPPVPAGHPFAVCLTHDVDHPVLRNHLIDHTAIGFLYRSTVGAVVNLFRGRATLVETLKNVSAALRFPLVHLGIVKDFWSTFDRYMEIENDLASTFFVLPRRDDPGMNVPSTQSDRRAAAYTLEEIRPQIDRIRSEGGEIGLHGIDAWTDLTQGQAEKQRITQITKTDNIGVRMHWLCFDESSPSVLDQAGFSYDSTSGYNETVGYRAGTLQIFRPAGVRNLLEIPLHIMDTALFYPAHLNLSRQEAAVLTRQIASDAVRLGGVLTINWHDRSIFPERQWDSFYSKLLGELKQLDPWFATAAQAAAWSRMRRSAVFEEVRRDGKVVKVKVRVTATSDEETQTPGLRLRLSRGIPQKLFPSIEQDFQSEAEITLAA
jgi:hypothetical protein